MRIVVETLIHAPREIVFDLARDIGAHTHSASFSGERAVPPGRTSGLLELGDSATFEGRHLGIRQRFTVRITKMQRPIRYTDEASHGALRNLRHVHEFEEAADGTLMRDTLEWTSPFGILTAWYLRRFVKKKQSALKRMVEE